MPHGPMNVKITTTGCVTTQKSAVLSYFAAEARNRANKFE